eukprot:scaffold2200_cov413-Prasinococcus_capsulatus_cf.AAC.9
MLAGLKLEQLDIGLFCDESLAHTSSIGNGPWTAGGPQRSTSAVERAIESAVELSGTSRDAGIAATLESPSLCSGGEKKDVLFRATNTVRRKVVA